MKKIFTLLFVCATIVARAQFDPDYEEESKGNIGFGLGVSYGGIGARLSYLPVRNVALFGAAGYNLEGLGYNFGAQFRLLPDKRAVPYLIAMYGYNGVIVVQGLEAYDATYYGPTIGGGVEIHSLNQQNFFTIELLVPFRPQEFYDRIDILKNNPDINMTGPWPVAFSFGYHMKF